MRPRSPEETHRVATPLELFFDLVFVVAIAQASAGLHHAIIEDHALQGLLGFVMAFCGIWWAWMNFTWFASAYDPDDAPYRLTVFVQMVGALIFTAGLEAMGRGDLRIGVLGYVVMRLAMVVQWSRAARADPPRAATARRNAVGVSLVQLAWVGLIFVPPAAIVPGFFLLVGAELAVPVWASRAGAVPFHPHHIAERYGLMTIIVLGESVLAATVATERALAEGTALIDLAPIIAGGLLTMFSLWWLYFERPGHLALAGRGRAWVWGYGHYFVFASAAMAGAAIAAAVDAGLGKSHADPRVTGAMFAGPLGVYLAALWWLHGRPASGRGPLVLALLLLGAAPFSGAPVLWSGVVVATLLAVELRRRPAAPRHA